MARVDDYKNAFKLAAEQLSKKNPEEISEMAKVAFHSAGEETEARFEFIFIDRIVYVTFPDVKVGYTDSDEEVPITEQVLILHYLNEAKGIPLTGEMITYREIPSGEFYYPAFFKRAEAPMLKAFGEDPEKLHKTAPIIRGVQVEGHGDAAAMFNPLPMIPVTLVVWGGDDEFEPSGKILFDKSIQHYLSTEDIAWVSGMIVYRLMRLAFETK